MRSWVVMALIFFVASLSWAQAPEETGFVVISKAPRQARVAIPVFRVRAQAEDAFQLTEELSSLLVKDLEKSGLFSFIPRNSYLRLEPISEEIEDWQAWNLIGAQVLIRGELNELVPGQFRLTLKLSDLPSQKLAVGKNYTGAKASLNRMIHRFADEAILWLTDKRGPFEARIAFVSNRTGRKEIYFADTDGRNVFQLTNTKKLNLSPTWLGGNMLYYTGYDQANPDLYLIELSGKKSLISSQAGLNITPAAGPGGKKIALAMETPGNNLDIYIMNPDGTKRQRVTSHPAADLEPTWSPDGYHIAFVSDRTGSPQIYWIDLSKGSEGEGNYPLRLTYYGNYNTSPAWSPDGRYIAYSRRVGNQFDLFLIDLKAEEGRSEIQLTNTPYNEEEPAWSPDSRMLIYSANPGGNYDIFMISIYRKEPIRITDWSSDETQPSWSLNLYQEGG